MPETLWITEGMEVNCDALGRCLSKTAPGADLGRRSKYSKWRREEQRTEETKRSQDNMEQSKIRQGTS